MWGPLSLQNEILPALVCPLVLQRNKEITIWGFGEILNGTRVCLGDDCVPATMSPLDSQWDFSSRSQWTASLPARPASTDPGSLVLVDPRGKILQRLDDIVIGDVFLFSGQVGFEFTHQLQCRVSPSLWVANGIACRANFGMREWVQTCSKFYNVRLAF